LKRKPIVGIPRALSFYTFYPLWRAFLENLGAEVILSSATNRDILEDGISETVNDACIPIKVFHGHVIDLAERADYLFVPRMISADGVSTYCPKFLGLPDMIRFVGRPLPPIIDARYNLQGFPGGQFRFFRTVAGQLGIKNPFKVYAAGLAALARHRRYMGLLQKGVDPLQASGAVLENKPYRARTSMASTNPGEELKLTVALLGYPYAVFDPYINAGIYDRLNKMGIDVITFEMIPERELKRMSRTIPQSFFWYYSNQVCWAGLYLLENKEIVDGIIHVTAFGCGPDAMVDKLLELEAKQAKVPFISLSIDEHTGEGGVQTRLEAFTDMLRFRKTKQEAAVNR